MIQASELRIGNLINGIYQNEDSNKEFIDLCKYEGYYPMDKYFYVESKNGIEEFERFEPIPLSEEILLKVGFENSFGDYIASDGFFTLKRDCDQFLYRDYLPMSPSIDYLHQLQNLYFALTGQELNTSGLINTNK